MVEIVEQTSGLLVVPHSACCIPVPSFIIIVISLFAHIKNYSDNTTINTSKTLIIYNNYYSKVIKSMILLASVQDITSQFPILHAYSAQLHCGVSSTYILSLFFKLCFCFCDQKIFVHKSIILTYLIFVR